MQFNPQEATPDNILRVLHTAMGQWATDLDDRPTGSEFLDDLSLFFLYAMAKFMNLERTMTDDPQAYLREGIEAIAEKLAEYGEDDRLVGNVLDNANNPPETKKITQLEGDSDTEEYVNSDGMRVVVQYD